MTRSAAYHWYDKALLWVMLIFFAAHMGNHLAILWGAQAHLAVMDVLRVVYRYPIVELILIWAIFRQVVAGIKQMRRFGPFKSKGRFRVLVWSGIYLIAFMIIHLSATAANRYVLGVDTNLYFATAGYRSLIASLFFYPYYFLAVVASFAHLGAVVWLRQRAVRPVFADRVYVGAVLSGIAIAAILTLFLSGLVADFPIPESYLVYP